MDWYPQNVHWLVPEEPSPCDIFLHFRGQFALGLPAGQAVSVRFLEKLDQANYLWIYIRKQDLKVWRDWQAARLPNVSAQLEQEKSKDEISRLYGNKRAELLSYLQKAFQKRHEDDHELNESFDQALAVMQRVIQLPTLDWYFQKFHEPPDLLYHNGRVAFAATAFARFYRLLSPSDLDALVYSSLIHQLEGDPAALEQKVVSQETLSSLEKAKHPVPADVIALIQYHDELYSGAGFPNNRKGTDIPAAVRIFSCVNHFDHHRLAATGTRRSRFERSKRMMESRKSDFDPKLWDSFWEFWERHVEVVA
jgi:hypothetical protein